ncbi:MAG: 50S ribosomal protein L4 [Candidatus Melainabacteria bacterium RIFOXYA12_FULL_32_12]|nr:MAG: 50S ribosomal protein L4 [Candidatus Melainabacteria bacterium GWF2_32_7]OGI19207.1 MAG: 50S ribosomal protein L4 [Candidatus Melainabacteria bacterium RIFOXYA2_FULL_32_9]OGI31786.1 MAG: 50S ribosomal protein L4 [Candidatus Melainabacteria bacterium RIFOXYA12_FULL_32_12]
MPKQTILHSSNGAQLGQIDLDEKVFGIEPNIHVMHLALRRQLTNARAGTASTKTRAEVRGGGKKPWKQKGTGRARAGSLRSPLFAGGGVIFGPKPRDYSISMPTKARRLALRSALSARTENIKIVKDFTAIAQPKTKELLKVLESLEISGKVLIIAELSNAENQHLGLSARNIPNVKVILPSNINVKDILEADNIIITESAISDITERLLKK